MKPDSRPAYCGPPGLKLSELTGLHNATGGVGSWFWESEIHYTHKGRTTIRRICDLLSLRGQEVLVPSYNCGSEIDPLIKGGAAIVPYRVDVHARIDIADLERHISNKTKAVYVTHYFGFPQPIEDIRMLCDQKRLYLIEDCALALFSCVAGRKLGTWGDVAVFSFTKTLALPDGGALVINNPGLRGQPWKIRQAPRSAVIRGMMSLCKSTLLRRLSESRLSYGPYRLLHDWLLRRKLANDDLFGSSEENLSDIRGDMYFSEELTDRRISNLARHLLTTINPDQIIARRRDNYLTLLRRLSDKLEVLPLYPDLPDGVCPLAFPVIVRDRNRIFENLYKRGIVTAAFWRGFHRGIEWARFPEARFLKNYVLMLPIHRMLTERDMKHIAESTLQLVSGTEAPTFRD